MKKIAASCIAFLTAAALMVGCSAQPLPENSLHTEKLSEKSAPVVPEKVPERFSVMTVSKDGRSLNADGYSGGNSLCGFTVHEDGNITVSVDGEKMSFGEASEKTGCYITENSDGTRSIRAPFQNSQVIVKAFNEFDSFGAESVEETVKNHFLLTYATQAEAYSAYRKLSEDENVEYAEPNEVMKACGYDDTIRIESWGKDALGSDEFCRNLSENNTELPEVDVAVIDSGIYSEHRVFKGRILDGGRSFCSEYDEKQFDKDGSGHGTHCAGIICSSTNDNVKILPVKVLDNNGLGDAYGIYCGMMYAIECGVDIISMSLGGYGKSIMYEEAVAEAQKKDITVCVAAGNDTFGNDDTYSSLSAIDGCVTVASVDKNLIPSEFSNFQNIDFAAPGEDILSAGIKSPDEEVKLSGTSMAAPFVAACFADVLSADSTLSAQKLYSIVKANAVDLCEPGYDDQTGWGMVSLKNFSMTDERPDIPSVPPSEKPVQTDFESDDFVIKNGVLERCSVKNTDVLNLAELVDEKIIPEFTELGKYVFSNLHVKEIILPDSVKKISERAFAECAALEKVVTSANVIEEAAFYGCRCLSEIDDSCITRVEKFSFNGCMSLEKADFTGLTEIPEFAFYSCSSLGNECFDFSKITLIDNCAFSLSGISGTTDIRSAVRIGNQAFSYTKIEEIYFSDKITILSQNVLTGCKMLKKISAPSVRVIDSMALSLYKDCLSEENAVETDIDFSKINRVGYGAFNGFVFSEPVSFDSLNDFSFDAFTGAYGESLSFPSVSENSESHGAKLKVNAVYMENAETINLYGVEFSGLLGAGDSLKNIIKNNFSDLSEMRMFSMNNNPDVMELIKQNDLNLHSGSWLYFPDENIGQPAKCFEPFSLHAVLPGQHLKYSWTVSEAETERVVVSRENSDYPICFIPAEPGSFSLNYRITDSSGNELVAGNTVMNFSLEYTSELTADQSEIIENFPVYDSCENNVFSFTPETDGSYFIYSSLPEAYLFSDDWQRTVLNDTKNEVELKAGHRYYIVLYSESERYLSVSVSREDSLIPISKVLNSNSVHIQFQDDGRKTVELITTDGTFLKEGTDYSVLNQLEVALNESDYIWVAGTGKYFGVYMCWMVARQQAEVDTWYSTSGKNEIFIPEKSAEYNIFCIPEKEKFEWAVSENKPLELFNAHADIYVIEGENTYPYNEYYHNREVFSPYYCETSAFLEKDKSYLIIISSSGEAAEYIITEKPSVSQCQAEYSFVYHDDGGSEPDLKLYDNGKLLEEGKDYRLTVWKNKEPGLVFAVAEGIGNYSGARNFGMINEGNGLTCEYVCGRETAGVRPDTEFEYLSVMPYTVTFDTDTYVSLRNMCSDDFKNYKMILSGYDQGTDEQIKADFDTDGFFVRKGRYRLEIENAFFSYKEPVYMEKFKIVTSDSKKALSDADVRIKYSEGKPEISLIYGGEVLSEGTDYSFEEYSERDGINLVKAVANPESIYGGTREIVYFSSGKSTETGVIHDGQACEIKPDMNVKYEWVPEKEKCWFTVSSYTMTDIIITDEENIQVWYGSANMKESAVFTAEPGKKYYVYVFSDFNDAFRLTVNNGGRLSECTAEYEALVPYSDSDEMPDVIFRDGDYILQEGKDYTAVTNGFVPDDGRREYLYRGCGEYYDDVIIPVVTYRETLESTEKFIDAREKMSYSFEHSKLGFPLPGSKICLRYTAASDGNYRLHMYGNQDSFEYNTVFLYDSEGKFIGSGDAAENFSPGKNQTVYIVVISPYFNDTVLQEKADEVSVCIEPAETISAVSGDVNCDGMVNTLDFMKLKMFIIGEFKLSENGRKNALLAGDGNRSTPDSSDLLMLKKMLVD